MATKYEDIDKRLVALEERVYGLEENTVTVADDSALVRANAGLRAIISALIALRSQGARITALALQEEYFPDEEVGIIGDVATDSRMLNSAGKEK